ncbi:DUF1707 SHOCT-like domain-containing protein [Actinomadura keratinilytica]|uniref:DUF1707 SHOCT-like domain-containing protein n=1 Tax=Actinomadura keratinilytica TaxID=547461 RepID=UPI003620ED22
MREAAGDGRISMDELQERLEAVYSAKTYAELEPLTRDLPVTGSPGPPVPRGGARLATGEEPTWRTGIGVLSGFHRQGVWAVPRKFTAFAFWGGGKIDLRDARYTSGEVRIRAVAVMGGIEIIAPDDITVHVKGLGVMGGFDGRASGPGAPARPGWSSAGSRSGAGWASSAGPASATATRTAATPSAGRACCPGRG